MQNNLLVGLKATWEFFKIQALSVIRKPFGIRTRVFFFPFVFKNAEADEEGFVFLKVCQDDEIELNNINNVP